MAIVLIRTVILYLIVLFVIRIMGKGELSKMSPFQLIVVFMIAELASIPIESPDVSMITGVSAIFTLLFLQVLISFLSIKSEKFKTFFNGKPSVLIDNGELNLKELKALRITINDLMEQLRIGGSPSISDVDYAIMESNGDLSIIQKPGKRSITPDDIALDTDPEIMPAVFISDGVIYSKNVIRSGWDMNKLKSELSAKGITDHKQVFLAFCDSQSVLHIFMTDRTKKRALEVKK